MKNATSVLSAGSVAGGGTIRNSVRSSLFVLSLVLAFGASAPLAFAAPSPTPSTNDINRTNGWAHVDQTSVGVGTIDLNFISTRGLWSCFEVRTDGDTSEILSGENGGANYNTLVTDGLYPYYCENNTSEPATILADQYVEVRMVFGGENDERFDWTRFDVTPAPALSAEDFGVVNDAVLKGYTAGFGLTGATLTGATSVVVKLYSGPLESDLMQTNTAILSKFNADITGTQFSSPFDVSGTFAYVTDGYWTNAKEAQYGQSVPATRVVATVTLVGDQIVTATNTIPTGDPATIYPPADRHYP